MISARQSRKLSIGQALSLFNKEAKRGTFDTGRYPCPYIVWGTGKPIIFIHGLADDYRSFVLPMAMLSQEFQCIAYNHPTGRPGEGRVRGYRHHHLVEDLWLLLEHLGISKATLLGSSFGSTIALKAMHENPRRIDKAILQGGFAHRPLARGEWWLSWFARYFPGTLRSLPLRREAMLKVHYTAFEESDPECWRFFLKQSGKPLIRAVARWALLLHRTDVRDLVPSIKQPVLLLCGDRDPLVPHASQEYLFNALPNAAMFLIEGCGHFPMFSHAEAFSHAVRQFMSQPNCPGMKSGPAEACHIIPASA